ncbi:MAG: hypothetical protein ACI9Y1_000113 [Lentisphaeria bacterium]|jgi:hypothetical protein
MLNKSPSEFVGRLLEASRKEVIRQYEVLLDSVAPRLRLDFKRLQEAEDKSIASGEPPSLTLDEFQIEVMAGDLNRSRLAMKDAFASKWHQIADNFILSEAEYDAHLKVTGFNLVGDELLADCIKTQSLVGEGAISLDYVLVPVSSGLSQALPGIMISHATIPFFPLSVAECIHESINACELNDYIEALLRELVKTSFFPGLKHLYLGIRKQFESQGYQLEEMPVRTRIERNSSASDVTAGKGNRLIEVDEDFDIEILKLLKETKVPAELLAGGKDSQKPSLSSPPGDLGDDQAIVTISPKDVDSMLATLQVLHQQSAQRELGIQQALAEDMLSRSSDDQYIVISSMSENIINLVALMFEYIEKDDSIPAIVSALLMRLQIPYMRMTLADAELFEDKKHPARLLLNDLTELGYMANSTTSKAYEIIKNSVTTLTDDFENSPEQISSLQEEINGYLQQIKEVAAEQEKSIEEQACLQSEIEDKLEEADAAVNEFVVGPISRIAKPMFFHSLLEKVWSRALHSCYMENMPLSEERSNAIDLFDKIVWSTAAGKTILTKPDLISALPAIVKRTEHVFSTCKIDELIRSHFMDQLQEIHLAFIKSAVGKKIKAIDEDSLQNIAKSRELVEELNKEQLLRDQREQEKREELAKEKYEQAVGHDYHKTEDAVVVASIKNVDSENEIDDAVLSVAEKPSYVEAEEIRAPAEFIATETESERASDLAAMEGDSEQVIEFSFSKTTEAPVAYSSLPITETDSTRLSMSDTLAIVECIQIGTYMEYMLKGEFKRCKVAFHAPSLGKYIFTDNNGFPLFNRFRGELIVDVQDGYAKILSNTSTFDRALESVISGIRSKRRETQGNLYNVEV